MRSRCRQRRLDKRVDELACVERTDRRTGHTFHTNISTLHVFISITFTETSIDETIKTQQKVRGSKSIFKMSTNHANTCIQTTAGMPLRNRYRDDVVHGPAASTPSADIVIISSSIIFQLLHVMDPRAVDFLLKHTPDAVVHRIKIWRIRWPHLWRDKLWRLSLCSMMTVSRAQCAGAPSCWKT